jgi:DNA-binding transcriptional LysR family regulator
MALNGRGFKLPSDFSFDADPGGTGLCCAFPNPALELRHLRYAITVAEELHFGRAAERLHLAAPSLSKQIKSLEAILGYQLFERNTRGVLITSPGAAFIEGARRAVLHVRCAISSGAAAVQGDYGVLNVGYTPWFDPCELPAIRAALTKEKPDTRLAFHSASTNVQLGFIMNGGLEAGIVVLPVPATGLRTRSIRREKLIVALWEAHAFAERHTICMRHLAGEPMIWVAKSVEPMLHEYLLSSCREYGFLPDIAYEVATAAEALDLVSTGAGMAFIKASTGLHLTRKGVAYREMEEPYLALEIGVAYHSANNSQALQAFLGVLGEQPELTRESLS